MTPSSDAIAGDYVTTFKATAPVANAEADVRVTIQTSLLWGVGRHRADRARADRPVVDVPAVRSPMSGVGAPAAAPPVEPGADAGASRRDRPSRAGHPDPPADQAVRDADRRRSARPRGLPRRDLRPARPERRRQDDDDPDAARPVRADRRRGVGDGPRSGLGAARGQAPGRLPARRGRLLRRHDRAPEPALHGTPQRPPRRPRPRTRSPRSSSRSG